MTTYDDYGRPGGSASARFGFTGHVALPEAGLVHMRARAYDPGTGSFLSPDPIGYGDGPNIYAYAGGDPVNRIDPWGLADKGMGPNLWAKPIFPAGDQKVDAAEVDIVVEGEIPEPPFPEPPPLTEPNEVFGLDGLFNPVESRMTETGGSSTQLIERPSARQQACAYSTGATVAAAGLGALGAGFAVIALIPGPHSPFLAGGAVLSAGLGAVLAVHGTIGEKAFCD